MSYDAPAAGAGGGEMSWGEWVHAPWHCPYCILTGFALGQTVVIVILGVSGALR